MKLLLVEDEPKLASFIRKGFENEGHEIETAYDGRMGLSLVRQNRYDLIVLDCRTSTASSCAASSGPTMRGCRCCCSPPSTASTTK